MSLVHRNYTENSVCNVQRLFSLPFFCLSSYCWKDIERRIFRQCCITRNNCNKVINSIFESCSLRHAIEIPLLKKKKLLIGEINPLRDLLRLIDFNRLQWQIVINYPEMLNIDIQSNLFCIYRNTNGNIYGGVEWITFVYSKDNFRA